MVDFLETAGTPYMVIGGIASGIYGVPRQTFDIDIKVLLETEVEIDSLVEDLRSRARMVPDEPKKFLVETNVLPVEINGVRIDLIPAVLPFEKEAIVRSQVVEHFGFKMKLCQPEDLIIQKSVSTRAKDWLDIELLIGTQRGNLDQEYVLRHCRELSHFLDDPSIYDRIQGWLSEGSE